MCSHTKKSWTWTTPSVDNKKTSISLESLYHFLLFILQPICSLFGIPADVFGPSFFLFSYFHVMWLPSWRWFIWTIPLSLWESGHHLNGMAYTLRHIQTRENEPRRSRRLQLPLTESHGERHRCYLHMNQNPPQTEADSSPQVKKTSLT